MQDVVISEIGIDEDGRLWVAPQGNTSFEMIFRSGKEVHWDSDRKRLFSPRPREWTYPRWFEQILAAVAEEYGASLKLTRATVWRNVPEDLQAAIAGGAT